MFFLCFVWVWSVLRNLVRGRISEYYPGESSGNTIGKFIWCMLEQSKNGVDWLMWRLWHRHVHGHTFLTPIKSNHHTFLHTPYLHHTSFLLNQVKLFSPLQSAPKLTPSPSLFLLLFKFQSVTISHFCFLSQKHFFTTIHLLLHTTKGTIFTEFFKLCSSSKLFILVRVMSLYHLFFKFWLYFHSWCFEFIICF